MNVTLIVGTDREGNRSQYAAKFIENVIAENYKDLDVTVVSPKDFIPNKTEDYKKINSKTDGYIIVIPEYNHSFPGALKLLLDADLQNYIHKPAAAVGVSAGPWGGTRGVQSIIPVLRELGLVMTSIDAYFTNSYDKLQDDGEFNGDIEQQTKGVKKMLDEFVWMAKALKEGRDS